MDERRLRLLAVIAAVTVLCGGVLVELVGAQAPSATNAINEASRDSVPVDAPPTDLGRPGPAWESTFLVDGTLADGARRDDHPLAIVAPPATGPRSSTTCSEVGEDGSQTCMTLTVDTEALDDVVLAPRDAPVRVLAPDSRPADPRATTGTPDEDSDR